jgi:hypothetical protein
MHSFVGELNSEVHLTFFEVVDYYEQIHAEEEKQADERRRKRLKEITADMNKDIAKTEHETFGKRGLIRGRKP